LGHIFNNATGQSFEQFAKKYFFKPMQIDSLLWYRTQCGIQDADIGLCITSRDFMKLGLLTINHGKWNNKQLINSEWIEKSVTPLFTKTKFKNESYGYYWWIKTFTVKDKNFDCYYAAGSEGQYLLVFPSQNLVIGFMGNQYLFRNWFNPLVSDFILPAFVK
jgi:CubicO group peptidase (beta-lactamase class C family)